MQAENEIGSRYFLKPFEKGRWSVGDNLSPVENGL